MEKQNTQNTSGGEDIAGDGLGWRRQSIAGRSICTVFSRSNMPTMETSEVSLNSEMKLFDDARDHVLERLRQDDEAHRFQ